MLGPLMPDRQVRLAKRGFTLVELLITVTIGAILMALAVPSMQGFIARKRLEGTASELVTDLRYMRSAKLERGREVSISFGSSNTKTCYVIYVEGFNPFARCNCSSEPVCNDVQSGAEALKVVSVPRSSGIELRSSPAKMTLIGLDALPKEGKTLQIAVVGTSGGEIAVTTNELARPSICSVSGYDNTLTPCSR